VSSRIPCEIHLLFHGLRVHLLDWFAACQALGDDETARFDPQRWQLSSKPDRAEDASRSANGNGRGSTQAMGERSAPMNIIE
jgi:hypothetical protein